MLTIFFIRGITLPGAGAGLLHMLEPKVEKLLETQVWLDAATQVFYSFGLAFGSLIAFGSYNTPKNNCVRDVLLVSLCNAVTAIYACVVIFAILGYKATKNVENCFTETRNIFLSHNVINSTNISDSDVYKIYLDFNATHPNESNAWKLQECSLEKMLSEVGEGTGLAFISEFYYTIKVNFKNNFKYFKNSFHTSNC